MNIPNLDYEEQLFGNIAGIDEAGRGPLVGPVVAAAVIIDKSNIIDGINDSKKLSANQRQTIYDKIITSYPYSIGIASVKEIDELNILRATKLAMKRALAQLPLQPDHILVDGNIKLETNIPIQSIIGGDRISISIAAASIIAKVHRDQLIIKLHDEFPQYNWQKNKGYGTKEHLAAITQHGISKYHRRTFSPAKDMISKYKINE